MEATINKTQFNTEIYMSTSLCLFHWKHFSLNHYAIEKKQCIF